MQPVDSIAPENTEWVGDWTDTPGDVVFHCPQEIPGMLRGWVVDVEERGEGWSCNILGEKGKPSGVEGLGVMRRGR